MPSEVNLLKFLFIFAMRFIFLSVILKYFEILESNAEIIYVNVEYKNV